MRKFYEDSSQAKILSSDKSIHCALRYLSEKPISHYELRDYSHGVCRRINTFFTKEAAMAAKSFHEIEEGCHFAVVAVSPLRFSQREWDYINSDKELLENFSNQVRG